MLSGALFVLKGLAILVSDADPGFVPPAILRRSWLAPRW